ncbi:MAG: hypothetical protein ACOYB8_01120 [Eubacteriaceae bacterium]|jgi:hypothetical protein
MNYRIAVASSDRIHVDLSFGSAKGFDIYEVNGKNFRFMEERIYVPSEVTAARKDNCPTENSCGNTERSCGNGMFCTHGETVFPKLQLIRDCRCLVCLKAGFSIQKQLEKMAVILFDVDSSTEEVLTGITGYLDRIDNHQSLRGLRRNSGDHAAEKQDSDEWNTRTEAGSGREKTSAENQEKNH